jgi:hypothetical protein
MAAGCSVPLKQQTAILCSRTTVQQGPDIPGKGEIAADLPSSGLDFWRKCWRLSRARRMVPQSPQRRAGAMLAGVDARG